MRNLRTKTITFRVQKYVTLILFPRTYRALSSLPKGTIVSSCRVVTKEIPEHMVSQWELFHLSRLLCISIAIRLTVIAHKEVVFARSNVYIRHVTPLTVAPFTPYQKSHSPLFATSTHFSLSLHTSALYDSFQPFHFFSSTYHSSTSNLLFFSSIYHSFTSCLLYLLSISFLCYTGH